MRVRVAWLFVLPCVIAANLPTFTYTVPFRTSVGGQDMSVNAIAIDSAGNTYLTGSTRSPLFQATPGAFQTQSHKDPSGGGCYNPATIFLLYTPCYDAFVIKLDPTGATVYATYLGGNSGDIGYAIAVDSQGNVYVSGATSPNQQNQPNTFPVTQGAAFPNPSTAFVAKLNPSGSQLIYSTFLPLAPQAALGQTADSPVRLAMAIDSGGNVYVTCAVGSFSATLGAFQVASRNPSAPGVIKLNASGSALVYATYLSGSPTFKNQNRFDFPQSITVDADGDAFRFAARFDPSGVLTGATYLGGSQADIANLIAVAPNGSVVIAGTTVSPDFPSINPPPMLGQTTNVGFVTSMFMDLTVLNAASYVAGVVSPGELVAIKGYQLGPAIAQQSAVAPRATPECIPGDPICFGIGPSGGFGAPVLYRQGEQINVQVPWELAGTTSTQIFLDYQGQIVNTSPGQAAPIGPFYGVPITGAVPGILSIDNSDGTRNSPSNPARPGDFITIYGTGGGLANATGVTGGSWPLSTPEPALTLRTHITIGGEDARVLYSGVSPLNASGIFQINVLVPADLPSSANASLGLTIGDGSSPPVPIAIGTR